MLNSKGKTASEKQRNRARFRRRAAVEPVIGHLKSDYRMLRNYLKGVEGDMINTIMAAVAFNMMKRLRQIRDAKLIISLSPSYRQVPHEFWNIIEKLTAEYDLIVFDHFNDKQLICNPEMFYDWEHLNDTGPRKFSDIIAQRLQNEIEIKFDPATPRALVPWIL